MRKILTIAALLLAVATAQSQSKYDNSHKYGLLSNIELAQGRAEAVFQRLVEYRVDPKRLLYSGNGATDYNRQGDQKAVITPIM